MIYLHTADSAEITLQETEIFRYLGYGKTAPDAQIAARIESIKQEAKERLTPRACYRIVPVAIASDEVHFGSFTITSKILSKHLADCDRALLFAATVGADADRMLFKYSHTSPVAAVIAQAVCTAAIESWCDVFIKRMKDKLKQENAFLRPRFSPGYGDVSITHQKDLFAALDVPRKIGVSLTEAYLMTPAKSVTAIAGISHHDTACTPSGCEICTKREDCIYARG